MTHVQYDPEIQKGYQMFSTALDKHVNKLYSLKLKYVPIKNELDELVQIVPEIEIFLKG